MFAALPILAHAAHKNEVHIKVQHVDADQFIASYEFPKPISAFAWKIPLNARSAWRSLSPALTLTPAGVSATDGSKFTSARFLVRKAQRQDREYNASIAMSDGGGLMYSSALEPALETGKASFELVPRPGGSVIAHGKLLANGARWKHPYHDPFLGSYVYFAAAKQAAKRPRLIADPQAPQWVIDEIGKTGERLADSYAALWPNYRRPVVSYIVTMEAPQETWFSSRGETLPGASLRMHVLGDWTMSTPEKLAQLRLVLAHEMFHLWNAELSKSLSPAIEVWAHEGSANYAAVHMLRAMGLIDELTANRRVNGMVNNCLESGWRSSGTASALAQRPYECGYTAFLLLAKAGASSTDQAGMGFLQKVLSAQRYSQDSIMSLAHESASPAVLTALKALHEPNGPSVPSALVAAFSEQGLKMEVATSSGLYVSSLLDQLLSADCGRPYGFWPLDKGWRIDTRAGCRSFSAEPVIRTLFGIDLVTEAGKAYALARNTCAQPGARLRFGIEGGGSIDTACVALKEVPGNLGVNLTL